ncbi:quaternary amine ABC transporter ATP-binding protein [Roseovarius indicus]|uniref:Glycine betaine transport ATP-binding protein OpuAA n=2 Tax=Roseovarius indicus TaxID=540747 RepID=A0A5P3ADE4_9RHOB|nr:ATP-binding cassette domain-containing protein [Roseovarius indicus]QEW27387.1 Glycine betaine transport ATP-binding protein OpuAA [Roseovarius indicus]SFD49271.1 glycine betaine/proline transport system ATP-binding protein [Roseovarius indicus]
MKDLQSSMTSETKQDVVIRCDAVWKLYGEAAGALAKGDAGQITDEVLAEREVIAAVRDVSLQVRRDEIFVIMGLSGSGKSTLLRCMAGLVEPTLGELEVAGYDLGRASPQKLIEMRRHAVSMVFQDFALLPHLTVLDNVAFPLRMQGVGKAERQKKARELVEMVGLAGREAYMPHELSGGQQQRVGIARSLMTEPEVWFLDEPFSALDPLIRAEMQSEFLRIQGMLRKSIVFVTHDFEEAVRLADRIAIMHSGRVVQVGTPEELITSPADDYVAKFTRKIPRRQVVKVGSVMVPAAGAVRGEPVKETDIVGDVAGQIVNADGPTDVVDAEGNLVGRIAAKTVIRLLLNEDVT